MTIFDIIKNLCFNKKTTTVDLETNASPFILQRWLSMYSPGIALLVNETSNQQWSSFASTQHWIDFWMVTIPKLPFKRITYLKKPIDDAAAKQTLDTQIAQLAEMLQISQREVRQYVEQQPNIVDLLSHLAEDSKIYKT